MDSFSLLGPALRRLDPEIAHRLTLWGLEHGLAPRAAAADEAVLATRVWDLAFANPLGLSAGFDKDARAMAGLLGLGFGFVEVGSLTPRPQPGNPRPRIFRLPEDGAVINRLGFNNGGARPAERLSQQRQARAGGNQSRQEQGQHRRRR